MNLKEKEQEWVCYTLADGSLMVWLSKQSWDDGSFFQHDDDGEAGDDGESLNLNAVDTGEHQRLNLP